MNRTLLAGLTITVLIILSSFFGHYIAPHDLNEHLAVDYQVDENGIATLIAPPSPPSAAYPFGTDKYGLDLMAKLLDGAKYTIIATVSIALTRICIGGVLGMLLGFLGTSKTSRAGRLPIWNMLNGIPILIIVWMIMIGISMNPASSPLKLTLILSIVMALVGIPTVASTVKEKTMVIREKQFILSAKSIGASQWTIIRTHLLPHLKESFIILFVQEIVLILELCGQLAIFHIFVGGTIVYINPWPELPEYISRTNEWSGLIGQARSNLDINQWLLFIPLLVYTVFILGFHLISLGLEKMYKQRFAKFSNI
ncbi:ABC transporter permease subunit [Paenibacillus sp. CF384]|uniref:ABC transporter permease subunit n=1 Tax=Paenibacillus sp. CF384 TaxID=1884382 RepID=UPI0008952CA9|nr:ABC transporter permease subunit [Paenibacillus sp. CF384]SDW76033.1 peptide/nickel transport system permease protein [Paenibacillus sp. CF384]